MSFFLSARKLDVRTGDTPIILLNESDAGEFGLTTGESVLLSWPGHNEISAKVDTTDTLVEEGQIGFFEDVWEQYGLNYGEVVKVSFLPPSNAVEAIRKKLLGGELDYKEIYAIINDIARNRMGNTLTAYYVAAGYSPGFNEQEIYYMTKAMAETGVILHYDGIVADKHSIGGVGGKGITPIVVPIVASLGVTVPNTSTRAITTSSATTDMLEVIMPMSFNKEQLDDMIDKIGTFMVWGGGLDLAPADDHIIQVQKKLGIESIDKFVASIVAKKVAQGVNHVIFDIPLGKNAKIHTEEEFIKVKNAFEKMCEKFGIKVVVHKRFVKGIDGSAIGPALECREFLRVFERDSRRSLQLEEDALQIAGELIELVGKAETGKGYDIAKGQLDNGQAFEKLRDIIEIQGGVRNISSNDLEIGGLTYAFESKVNGKISEVNNKHIFELGRALGNPHVKEAGIIFHKFPGDDVEIGERLLTIYATSQSRMDLGKKVLETLSIFEFEQQ